MGVSNNIWLLNSSYLNKNLAITDIESHSKLITDAIKGTLLKSQALSYAIVAYWGA